MADPITAIAIASMATAGVSAYSQGQNQKHQFQAKAEADQYNAILMKQRADQALSASGQREEQQRRAARIQQGKQRAAIAESGTGFGGSNADIAQQSEIAAELDALNIRYEGELQSKGLLAQSTIDSYQSKNNQDNAGFANQATWLNVGSSLLSGTGNYLNATKTPTVKAGG